jgi:hypothetical protein
MMTKTVTASDYPVNAIPFLEGVERGYDVDIRTPLFKGEDRGTVAEEWASILQKNAHRMVDELVTIETIQQHKIGSISRRKPFSGRRQDVESYYTVRSAPDLDFSEIRDKLTANKVEYTVTPNRRLRPVSYDIAASRLPHNTNSGLPLFKKRKTVLRESIDMAISGEYHPAMLGWRGSSGQSGDYFPKQRVVWMMPFSHNIREARFQIPYHAVMLKQPEYFAALISMDEVDRQITWLFDNLPDNAYMMATDYSKYDQTIQHQQSWFFLRLSEHFQTSTHEELSRLHHYARNGELLCTREIKYIGSHGWGSGLNMTNSGDSTINRDAQMSSPVVIGRAFQIQGDDSAGRVWDPDSHLRHLERCGFDLNSEKQYVSKSATIYLQRLYHTNYRIEGILRGQYPTMRALNSLLGMERFHADWDKDMESLRTLAILENCKWHPLFPEFVSFVVKRGDLYLKEFVANLSNGTFRRSIVTKATSTPGFVPTYNQQDTIGGILTFEAVRQVQSF